MLQLLGQLDHLLHADNVHVHGHSAIQIVFKKSINNKVLSKRDGIVNHKLDNFRFFFNYRSAWSYNFSASE